MDKKTNYEQKAKLFAYKAHEGQLRKDGVTPYIEHPKAVVGILKNAGVISDAVLSAAWLHDVVEDCEVSLETVRAEFGTEISDIVDCLTQRKKEGESKEAYRERILNSNEGAKIAKLADLLHNMRTIVTLVPEKRMKIYKNMSDSWTTFKNYALELCPELAQTIEVDYQILSRQIGGV